MWLTSLLQLTERISATLQRQVLSMQELVANPRGVLERSLWRRSSRESANERHLPWCCAYRRRSALAYRRHPCRSIQPSAGGGC